MRIRGGWSDDPLWGTFYDWMVSHPTPGRVLWRLGIGSDLQMLYDAADELGRLPAGARVLDVPCGGGGGRAPRRTTRAGTRLRRL